MRYLNRVTIAVSIATLHVNAQPKQFPGKEPLAFEAFCTGDIKRTEGTFPVYRRNGNYYLEIPAASLNRDILVLGYVQRGYSGVVAKSSGILHFSMGLNNHLDVTHPVLNEATTGNVNGDMDAVIQKSNKIPVNYSYRIEALGRDKKSYIIDITRQITEAGDWFSFADIGSLNRPDPQRSFVQNILPAEDAVRFIVERSQSDYGKDMTNGRNVERTNTYQVELLFQQLPDKRMPRRMAERNSGFETFSFTDYGKVAYTTRKSVFIRKWDIRSAGRGTRSKGLMKPISTIKVAIDPNTPTFYRRYIIEGILAWNKAFHTAGYEDVIEITGKGEDLRLAPGRVLVNWGNAYSKVLTSTVENPETGEIITARMNLSEGVAMELMFKYLMQCGATDNRIIKDIKDHEVMGAILRWKVTQAMGEILGLKANLSGSTRYSPDQLRNAAWLNDNGFSASVMDDLEFNYLVQPEDKVPVEELIPRIGVADIAAIRWAYGCDSTTMPYVFLPENKQDPFTQHADLSSDKVEASTLGLKNLERIFAHLGTISSQLDGSEDLFDYYGSLYGAVLKAYEKYIMDVIPLIGGVSLQENKKIVIPVAQQRKALEFLSRYLFSGAPAWMNVKVTPNGRIVDIEGAFQRMEGKVLGNITDIEVLGRLVGERTTASTLPVEELFTFIDREVFKDFNPDTPLSSAERSVQVGFVNNLAQDAFKANISNGLNDAAVLLHYYFTNLVIKIDHLSENHKDILSRQNFRLMKMKADREFFNKIKV